MTDRIEEVKKIKCTFCNGTGMRQKNIAKEPRRGWKDPQFNLPICCKPIYKEVSCEVCDGTGEREIEGGK